jgi:hypothetical protein
VKFTAGTFPAPETMVGAVTVTPFIPVPSLPYPEESGTVFPTAESSVQRPSRVSFRVRLLNDWTGGVKTGLPPGSMSTLPPLFVKVAAGSAVNVPLTVKVVEGAVKVPFRINPAFIWTGVDPALKFPEGSIVVFPPIVMLLPEELRVPVTVRLPPVVSAYPLERVTVDPDAMATLP